MPLEYCNHGLTLPKIFLMRNFIIFVVHWRKNGTILKEHDLRVGQTGRTMKADTVSDNTRKNARHVLIK